MFSPALLFKTGLPVTSQSVCNGSDQLLWFQTADYIFLCSESINARPATLSLHGVCIGSTATSWANQSRFLSMNIKPIESPERSKHNTRCEPMKCRIKSHTWMLPNCTNLPKGFFGLDSVYVANLGWHRVGDEAQGSVLVVAAFSVAGRAQHWPRAGFQAGRMTFGYKKQVGKQLQHQDHRIEGRTIGKNVIRFEQGANVKIKPYIPPNKASSLWHTMSRPVPNPSVKVWSQDESPFDDGQGPKAQNIAATNRHSKTHSQRARTSPYTTLQRANTSSSLPAENWENWAAHRMVRLAEHDPQRLLLPLKPCLNPQPWVPRTVHDPSAALGIMSD
ncbi:hypothetical protein BKA70DRAFT_1216027 [Coprinopsis sp. MPI-PUGE-AT-0042]|nr:hypothetical protein BKA70DRAFT_1216027 [Coprinopsis sp. MPI-PUGE-AT-0042]